jgi:hypothetical protein
MLSPSSGRNIALLTLASALRCPELRRFAPIPFRARVAPLTQAVGIHRWLVRRQLCRSTARPDQECKRQQHSRHRSGQPPKWLVSRNNKLKLRSERRLITNGYPPAMSLRKCPSRKRLCSAARFVFNGRQVIVITFTGPSEAETGADVLRPSPQGFSGDGSIAALHPRSGRPRPHAGPSNGRRKPDG